MEKIPASQLIEADDDFVRSLHKKLKVINDEEQRGYEKLNTNEVAELANKSVQTIRSHIKNYIRKNKDTKQLKVQNPDSNRNYIILRMDLEQYIKNPKQTL